MQVEKAKDYVMDLLRNQLPSYLTYHDIHHTENVVRRSLELAAAEDINDSHQLDLLKTAAYYHDCGFINVYENHEEEGCRIAKNVLPQFDYSDKDIEIICEMIMKTKLPQQPKTHLEKILCDSDLDHLGRDDFNIIGDKLYREWSSIGKMHNEKEWNEIQVNFLQSHHFWTETSRKKRQAKKEENLKELKEKLYC